jgi:hypothetical protein
MKLAALRQLPQRDAAMRCHLAKKSCCLTQTTLQTYLTQEESITIAMAQHENQIKGRHAAIKVENFSLWQVG